MSLFGKILALFNVLGAIALFFLAVMDYSKRQSWAHSVLQHELLLRGMPLDDEELDPQGRPLVNALPEKTVKDHFQTVGGNEQATQVDEVKRLQKSFESTLATMTTDGKPQVQQQTYYLSRLLLPLSDSYLEREEMLAARHYFADEARLKELRNRYRIGFQEAVKRVNEEVKAGPKLTFDEATYVAMRARGGEPSDVFTMTFISQLPSDPVQLKAARFDEAFDKAVMVQLEALRGRLKEKFDRALLGPNVPKSTPGQGADTQKRVIARLLFALAQPIAEEKAKEDAKLKAIADPHSKAYAEALVETEAYKEQIRRVYAVSGLKMTLAAIADEIAEVRKQATEAIRAQEKDLINFVADHGALVEELRDRYELLKTEEDRVRDNTEKLKAQQELVKKSEAKVKALQEQLKAARGVTAKEAEALREVSTEVLKLRLEVRDAIKQTEEAEREIRRLEAIIRARENPQRTSKSKE